jgi:AraC-like DNA-binding protein
MSPTVRSADAGRLERSCGPRSDSIRFGPSAYGVERAEVYISAHGFDPHRHDTYGIGITTSGVATFRYRGAQRVCLLGQLQVLHPDETHDGGPGTEDGFGYRILYIAPELVRGALGGRALPFVADPVQEPKPKALPLVALLADIDDPISELSSAEVAVAVADSLLSFSDRPDRRRGTVDIRAVEQVREYLAAHAREQTPASTLEKIAGADRFTITRHFRWAFGTSPDRYRTMRRLALAQTAIESGQSLAQVAADTGFADQSHMARHFKRTYGLTPSRWRALRAASSIERRDGDGHPVMRAATSLASDCVGSSERNARCS